MSNPFSTSPRGAISVEVVTASDFPKWLKKRPASEKSWIEAHGFKGQSGQHMVIPTGKGGISSVVLGRGDSPSLWDFGDLPNRLPQGVYRVEGVSSGAEATGAALAWGLGWYRFDRYKSLSQPKARLVWPKGADRALVEREVAGIALCRDLINTPANDMGPSDLAAAARKLARAHKAKIRVVTDDALLKQNYPAIHAVGRAATNAPRLIDITWGAAKAPKVTLVGKGVCFDTGGLDIKPAAGMKMMKKDMGGAAHVLGIASVLMAAKAPIRLRVLIPAVENSIAGNAMRPLDIVRSRRGTTIEIGHTDAEGRVILADALTDAVAENPDLIVDFATLTGAARVALGTDVPALFCNDDRLARDILDASGTLEDPLWRMPLWPGYRTMVEGKQADLTNAPEGGYGGAITAALFLEHFATPAKGDPIPWAHIDLMAWNLRPRPGRPVGGEAMGLRAIAHMILDRYPAKTKVKR